MPGKSKKQRRALKPEAVAPLASGNLPAPEHVPKARVGEVVQDFINVGGAIAVEAHQEDSNTWLVTATA